MWFGRSVWLAGLALFSMSVRAADLPLIQPPADWVKPVVLDPTPSKLSKDAPIATLLRDYQARLQPDGTAFYVEIVTKAQTPQGLQMIGSVTVPWDPATQRLIIHKLKVLRDGKEIDYLTTGPGFLTLRRETKLEAATLDGTLTATTQIEGLEVGDSLDFAYTIEHTDPIMKGRVQADWPLNAGPLHRAHLRVLWPASMKVGWRSLAHAPEMTVRTKGDWTEATLEREDPVDPIPPMAAPYRYGRGPELQFGNFAGWSDVSALLADEFAEAEVSAAGSPLMEQAKSIAARISDPKARAEAALDLVQDKIRYVLLALNGGGLKPAGVDLTWTRRFADCKGKTVVLLALLKALDIEAEPALVSSGAGDGLDQRMPMLAAFDHVLVRATIGDRVYWLDGTRTGDHTLDKIRTPAFHWALPIRTAGGDLIKLEPQDLDQPETELSLHLDASAGLTLPSSAHAEMVERGDGAVGLNLQLANLSPANLDKALRDYWRKRYDYIEIKSVEAHFDAEAREERLTMDGMATLDWKTGGGYEISSVEYQKFDFQRPPGPDSDAPFAVNFPRFTRNIDTVILPYRGQNFSFIGEQVDEIDVGVHMLRHISIDKGVFTAETQTHAVMTEVPRAEAEAAVKRMSDLSKRAVRILPPYGASTPAERAALMSSSPESAEQYLSRGNAFLQGRKYDEALADFDKAVTLDPASSQALADRALTWAWKNDFAKSLSDADQALKLDSRQIVAYRAKGLSATRQEHWPEAIAAYSAALAINRTDIFSLTRRLEAALRSSDAKTALQDAEAGLAIDPGYMLFLDGKAVALVDLGRSEEALAAVRALVAAHPNNAEALVRAAHRLRRLGHDDEAGAAIDRAAARDPSAEMLLTRAEFASFANLDRGLADAQAALKLDGKSAQATVLLAKLNYQAGHFAEALRWGTQAMQGNPNDMETLALIGGLHHALGQDPAAAADFARVRKEAGANPEALNDLCWNEATAGYDLPNALTDCDAALQAAPERSSIQDSRAFVLLRLGRNEEALAQYDAAVGHGAMHAETYFGRSIAERRIGQTDAAERDRTLAISKKKDVADWFRLYRVES